MSQLFDTSTYAIELDANDHPFDPFDPAHRADEGPGGDVSGRARHLKSVAEPGSEPVWALDPDTIATGRRGIARARQALRDTRPSETGQSDTSKRSAA